MTDNGHDPRIDTTDSYPLDDAILELLSQTLRQMDAIKAFREGALMLFMMQHKLGPGDWRLAENAKELVRAPQAQAAIKSNANA